jgi:hypothetical protein
MQQLEPSLGTPSTDDGMNGFSRIDPKFYEV